jgi:uncharacterized membrane protein
MSLKKLDWIDFMKGFAILAVLTDHLSGTYKNNNFHLHSQFSVTIFIFLAGITACISISRNQGKQGYILKRVLGVFIPYAVATFVNHLYSNKYHFDFIVFKDQLLHFNASGPFYSIFHAACFDLHNTL